MTGVQTCALPIWYCLAGAAGPVPSTNKVLIAQITTNGIFHFELNIQIGTPTGGTENYVYSNPVSGELTIPSLTQTFLAVPLLPTVSITAPTEGATSSIGSAVSLAATAADADGSVTQVEFFVDGVVVPLIIKQFFDFKGIDLDQAVFALQ